MEAVTHLLLTYRYLILFPLAAFEGPIIAFLVGVFTAQGFFNPFAAYGVLLLGDLIPDTAYYLMGRYGADNPKVLWFLRKIGVTTEHMRMMEHLWHNHGKKTMFIGKLAYGLSTPFLATAGFAKMPFRRFVSYTLPVSITQYGVLMALGYYFSSSFNIVSASLRDIEYLAAGVIVVAIVYAILVRRMRDRLLKEEKEVATEEQERT